MSFFYSFFRFTSTSCRNGISFRDIINLLTLISSILVSTSTLANVAVWSGFGGAEKNDGVFVFPSSADSWAGYSNTNDSIYPLSFPEGGIITFTASSNTAVDVRFRLEWQSYPDVDPSYNTSSVNVNGATESIYSIAIPSQDNNTFSSFILYLDDRDAPVVINNVQIIANSSQSGCDSSPQSNGVVKVEAECFSIQDGIQVETTNDAGGGQNIGFIDTFDSLTYIVDVPSNSNYLLSYRIASQIGSDPGFRVFIDGEYSDIFAIPPTGGWQSWQTQQGRVVALNSGPHVIRFDAASDGMNLNWFSLTPTSSAVDDPPPNGDDIDVNGVPVDATKWFHQTRLPNGNSWWNNEIQHYTNRTQNSYVSDGTLKVVARKEAFIDQGVTKQYTSARLNSKFAFKYGVAEFRAKMPIGTGTWPAIWMLGKSISEPGTYWATQGYGTTGWPEVGEIDILEHWGSNQNYAQSAMHTTSSHGGTVNKGGRYIPTISSEFHTYTMDWNANRIIFKIDGQEHYTYNPSVKNADTWPYDSEFFFLLNVAIEQNIASGFTQSAMEVDYIRVYQSGNLVWSDEFNTNSDGGTDPVDPVDPVDPASAIFSGAFGGAVVDGNNYIFPSNAESWAGFANEIDGLYPFSFPNGGTLTFTGAAPSGDVDVRFRFERLPYPEVDPSYDTASVTVSGAQAANYSIEIPPQGGYTFSSFLLYIVDRDIPVTISNVIVTTAGEPIDPVDPSELQIVSVSNPGAVSPGQQFTLDINYDVSSGNNSLTGLGLRVHYDSSKLTFSQVSDYIAKDIVSTEFSSTIDTDDFDNNPTTDQFVTLAWASVFSSDWPSMPLPVKLLGIDFIVNDIALENTETTTIGFSSSSNDAGFDFSGSHYLLQITSATTTWDIDLNGEADALTDGLLMLRYAFGLTGEVLLDNAVAIDSPLTSSEVEQNITATLSIADIDNNGQVDALTDGLLLLRYLFGLTGEALISDAVALDGERETHAKIEQYIIDHMPGQTSQAPDNAPP